MNKSSRAERTWHSGSAELLIAEYHLSLALITVCADSSVFFCQHALRNQSCDAVTV
jgi:hypothetical protein